jgi:hypothetical protein
MDTDWFAVDKCGHVAHFRSGEAGAVPRQAAISMGPDGGDDELNKAIFGESADETEDDDWPNAAGSGVFAYEHETENWIAGPYQREGSPETPVRLENLPADVRARLGKMRFDGFCFGETARIQPVELTKCESWEPAWLSLDGKTARPFPGHEKEYREIYEEQKADGLSDGVTWEPPAAPAPPSAPASAPGGFRAWLRRLFGGS